MVIINGITKTSWKFTLILLVLGLALIFQSENTIITISYVIGGILIALGAMSFLKKPKEGGSSREMDITYAVIAAALGSLIIFNPTIIATVIPIVIGVGMIFSGAAKLQIAMTLRKAKIAIWQSTMIMSVISVLIGVLLVFNPFSTAVLMLRVMGILIVGFTLIDLISSRRIKKNYPGSSKEHTGKIIDDSAIDVEVKVKDKK